MQKDLCYPVSRRPAAGRAALNTDGPGILTLVSDLIGESDQFVPGARSLVVVLLELGRIVPDGALIHSLIKDRIKVVLVGTQINPGLRVVLFELCHIDEIIERFELVLGG